MSACAARLSVLIATALLAGCSGISDTASVEGCAPDAAPANLNFTLKDMHGQDVALASSEGRVIILDFWATWCGPCKFEIPGFIDLYTRYQDDGLQVLGVSVDDPVPALLEYAAQMQMNYPVLVGEGRDDIVEAFGPLPGLPTTFIIGRDGKICTSHTGFTELDTFERQVRALL